MSVKKKLQVVVIDGMGGGLGAQIVTKLKERLGEELEIVALGTNAMATSRMVQSGALRGATGENAIRVNINHADLIIGPVGIMMPNALMGEITLTMADSISLAPGKKILLPVNQQHFLLVGMKQRPLAELIDELVLAVKAEIR